MSENKCRVLAMRTTAIIGWWLLIGCRTMGGTFIAPARSAAAKGERVMTGGRVGVRDAFGNEGQAPIRVRLPSANRDGPNSVGKI